MKHNREILLKCQKVKSLGFETDTETNNFKMKMALNICFFSIIEVFASILTLAMVT